MKFSCLLSCLGFAMCWSMPALAEDKSTSTQLAELQAKASQGDAQAQYELARHFVAGDLVAKDQAAALLWFEKAAAQDHTKAEVQLGSIHAHGFGVPQDWDESLRWYRRAAAKGDTTAQHNLGLDYAHGHGVERDLAQAGVWFRKAADQGHARAQFNLGELVELGQGTPVNYLRAYVLYTLAGEHENQLHIFGQSKAAEVIAKRARVRQKLTPAELQTAEQEVAAARALVGVHPRKFGSPGLIGRTRGWFVWKAWNPATWEAVVTTDPPSEDFKVRVLPWATTYRHLSYGAGFDALLPGEKLNMFFDPSEVHRRGYVVHFQDEISQMKGHGHAWKIQEVQSPGKFTAQVFAGEKPLEEKLHPFEIDPDCKFWREGKQAKRFPVQRDDRVYMTWVYQGDRRVVMLLTDAASLEALKQQETERITAEVAGQGMAGELETVGADQTQVMIYSTHWSQAGRLKPGQHVQLATTSPNYQPTKQRVPAEVVSRTNRGRYGSGVIDVVLKLQNPADAKSLAEHYFEVVRLIPGAAP